jgi:hypothetical protein
MKLRDILTNRSTTEADRDASVAMVQNHLRNARRAGQGKSDVVRQSAETVASRARQAAGLDR